MEIRYPHALDFSYPELTNEERLIFDQTLQFGLSNIAPHVENWDEEHIFPREVAELLAEAGFFGSTFPEEMGGSNLSMTMQYMISKAFGFVCPAVVVMLAVHNNLAGSVFVKEGSPEQHEKYGADFASGKKRLCFGLTEPGAGSNPRLINGSSVKHSNKGEPGYLINTTKIFISAAILADYMITVVKLEGDPRKFNVFLVDLKAEEVTVSEPIRKMGMHDSLTSEVHIENLWLPESARIGEEGEGWKAVQNLISGRINVCGQASGMAYASYALAKPYADQRVLDDRADSLTHVSDMPAMQAMFANAARELSVMDFLGLRAAREYDFGNDRMRLLHFVHQAKAYIPKAAQAVIDDMLQTQGGFGYTAEAHFERYWRAVRVLRIYEGPDEVNLAVAAQTLPKI